MGRGEKPQECIGETRIKSRLVTLPSPRLWFEKPVVFQSPQGPKTSRTILIWGADLSLMGQKKRREGRDKE